MTGTMSADERNLRRFAAYYGFSHGLLSGDDRYRIEDAPADFDGRIERIRLTERGRFGNIFYQILHAVLLARQLGCGILEVFPFPGGPSTPTVQVEDLLFIFRPPAERHAGTRTGGGGPALVGSFFNSYAFESALRWIPPETLWDVIQRYMRPLFRQVLDTASPPGPQTLVLHFRAGDIFQGTAIHPWYVQPPASYYTSAISWARETLGIVDVRLIFEDQGNPAIGITEAYLTQHGIPYASQSGDLLADFGCLAAASHLVASFSTLCEVLAMLSERLRSYIAFRQFESHDHIHARAVPLVLMVLWQKGIRAVLVEDEAGDYIPPLCWDGSVAQLRLLRDYPASGLTTMETAPTADGIAAPAKISGAVRLMEAGQEAARLRLDLIAARQHAAGVLADLHRSTSWRLTAPLRLLGQRVKGCIRVAAASRRR